MAAAVRALVLYSLMEFQMGGATTIRVTRHGRDFGISDDGRGHPLDKCLEGISYLRFIYTHFDYPFGAATGAPIQLQGIGMSLINALCEELRLTVRKHEETLTLACQGGRIAGIHRATATNDEAGLTVSARLRRDLPCSDCGDDELEDWLNALARAHPALRLFFNGHPMGQRPANAGSAQLGS